MLFSDCLCFIVVLLLFYLTNCLGCKRVTKVFFSNTSREVGPSRHGRRGYTAPQLLDFEYEPVAHPPMVVVDVVTDFLPAPHLAIVNDKVVLVQQPRAEGS